MTDTSREEHARRIIAATIVALMAAGIAYRALVLKQLEHSSLVFMGIPAIIAVATLWVRPRSAIGTINKTILIALCMSGAVFGEAFVCILMAAPIFLLVGTLVGVFINWIRRWNSNDPPSNWRGALGIALLPFGLEGVMPAFEFNRNEHVSVTQTVDASPAAVRAALSSIPQFDRALPPFLTLGFPVPGHASGAGLEIGDRRSVMFLHGEHHSGALVMAVTQSDSSSVTFSPVSDSSYITHWLAWQNATVEWKQVGPARTSVTWTLRYRRRLDPAWYFMPLERYGATLAARYLIETLASPGGARSPALAGLAPAAGVVR